MGGWSLAETLISPKYLFLSLHPKSKIVGHVKKANFATKINPLSVFHCRSWIWFRPVGRWPLAETHIWGFFFFSNKSSACLAMPYWWKVVCLCICLCLCSVEDALHIALLKDQSENPHVYKFSSFISIFEYITVIYQKRLQWGISNFKDNLFVRAWWWLHKSLSNS